jgi:hypothetical protein
VILPFEEGLELQQHKNWRFNSLFEHNSLGDAIKKACEMEVERATWTQLPLLQELYRPGWNEWKNFPGPGADLVLELVEWENGVNKDHKGDPWFPKAHACEYAWKGELSEEQLRYVSLQQYVVASGGGGTPSFAIPKAFLEEKKELMQLIGFWLFDEETHREMIRYSLKSRFKFTDSQITTAFSKQFAEIKSDEMAEINKGTIRTVNRFAAMRYGPAILAGSNLLLERENIWTNQRSAEVFPKLYGFTNDQMVPINVHTYIDLFHVRIGEYLVAKYVQTEEEAEMIRVLFQNQKLVQMERSKLWHAKLRTGEQIKTTKSDMDGNVG